MESQSLALMIPGEQSASVLWLWASTPSVPPHTLKKLVELRLNIRSASLMGAFRLVAVPAPPVVVVVAAPLI
jgi:hypothetical protein